MVNYKQSNNK